MLAPNDTWKSLTPRELLAELDDYSVVMVRIGAAYTTLIGGMWVRIPKSKMRECIASWGEDSGARYAIKSNGQTVYVLAHDLD